MALTEMLIAAACMNSPSNYIQACTNAADAGTRQVGIRQNVDMFETFTSKFADKEAQSLFGKKGVSVMGTGMFIYKATTDKKVNLPLPSMGLCDQVSTELTTDSQLLRLQWTFK